MTDLTIPDEAVAAAAWDNPTPCAQCDEGPARPCLACLGQAREMLTAALPILHPTIPNTVEALEQLAIASGAQAIIRGLDQDDDPITAICVSWDSEYLALWVTDMAEERHTLRLVDLTTSRDIRITEWTVLWSLGGAA